MKKIKSWTGERVRIKEEYIKKDTNIDEDKSIYDCNDNIIKSVYHHYEWIDTDNAMNAILCNRIREIFHVEADFYGADLLKFRNNRYRDEAIDIDSLPEPAHHIIINGEYTFLWESKYFEIVKPMKQEVKWEAVEREEGLIN